MTPGEGRRATKRLVYIEKERLKGHICNRTDWCGFVWKTGGTSSQATSARRCTGFRRSGMPRLLDYYIIGDSGLTPFPILRQPGESRGMSSIADSWSC